MAEKSWLHSCWPLAASRVGDNACFLYDSHTSRPGLLAPCTLPSERKLLRLHSDRIRIVESWVPDLMIWSLRLNLQPSHMEATTGCSSSRDLQAATSRRRGVTPRAFGRRWKSGTVSKNSIRSSNRRA